MALGDSEPDAVLHIYDNSVRDPFVTDQVALFLEERFQAKFKKCEAF